MKFLENLSKKLNQNQKIIVGIIVALILLIIALAIIDIIGYSSFNWEDIWFIWVLFIAIIGYFEYKLFGSYEDEE